MAVTKYTHLVGRAGRDGEFKTTPGGKSLLKFSLAVEEGWDGDEKKVVTRWYDVSAWDALADSLIGKIKTGSRLWVFGKTSVYSGTSGDRDQISAREVGTVDRFMVAPVVDDDDDEAAEDTTMDGIDDGEW
jgi:single-stranded DNA-binding protein